MSPVGRMKGKRVLVTGAASGIGRAIAQRMAEEGALVAICDVDPEALRAAKESQPEWLCIRTDVSSESEVAQMMEVVRARLGGLDCLVCNAGIAGPTGPIEAITLDQWEAVQACNVRGSFLCARAGAPLLKAQGGSLIILSSIAGRMGIPFRTPYASTKWALIGLAKSLALEMGEFKVRVNAILPGLTRGPRLDGVIQARAQSAGRSFDEQVALEVGSTALREMGEALDIANAALYLASDEGRLVTGVALAVDAGLESVTFR
ncbi:MAG: SDR family oxidoreductase [Hylemonella sp.]|nr:SDR family oxidoreductase [Hylemonella sp.]